MAILCVLALGVAACGDSDDSAQPMSAPAPAKPEDFPSANGKTLQQLLAQVGERGPVLAASVSQFKPGENRFGFALFDLARAQIAEAPVALYFAPAGGGRAVGPISAKFEEMAVKPQFQSETVARDDDAAKSLYIAQVDFPKTGQYDIIGLTQLDGRLVAATPVGGPLEVTRDGGPAPDVGDMAPRIDTETINDAGGDITKLDTRQPPSTMHDVNFADVVGKKPAVLLFATAALCQSRVCGPVIDVTEQVKAERGDEVAFVHQEIFKDNDLGQGFRPQVAAFGLPTEPWVFAIDANGRVAARIEGAFSADELNAAIDKAERGS